MDEQDGVDPYGKLSEITESFDNNEATQALVKLVGGFDLNTELGKIDFDAFTDIVHLNHTRTRRAAIDIEIINATYDYKKLAEVKSPHRDHLDEVSKDTIIDYAKETNAYAEVMATTADEIEKLKEEEQEIERLIAEKRAESLQNGDSQYLHTSVIVDSFVTKLIDENRTKGQLNPYFAVDQNLVRMAEAVERKFKDKTPGAA